MSKQTDADMLALDSGGSRRRRDENGYLHVEASHITKAQVAPYRGDEVPRWQEFGLEPNKIYYAYRDADELVKSLPTWNGVPLHIEHHEDSAADPQKLTRVGAMGTNAVWNPPYVDNSLVVWDEAAIEAIEDGSFKELSCAYRYEPDFTPGEVDGIHYDFVMRNIRANHVALVAEGRAGADVVVADGALKTESGDDSAKTEKGSAAMEEEKNIVLDEEMKTAMADCGLDAENETEAKAFAAGMKFGKAAEPAPDAEGKEEASAADAEEPVEPPAGGEEVPAPVVDDIDGDEIIRGVLEELAGLEEAKREKIRALLAKLRGGAPAESSAPAGDGSPVGAADSAAIKKSLRDEMMAEFRAKYEAARAVRPVCGELDPMAFDSADAIYGAALKAKGVDIGKYPAGTWAATFDAYMSVSRSAPLIAADSALSDFGGEFAGLKNISIGE